MSEENHIIRERRERLAQLRKEGNPFPNNFQPNANAEELRETFGELDREGLEEVDNIYLLAGRLMSFRRQGKMIFADIVDHSGRIQLVMRKDLVEEEAFNFFRSLDIGDIVGVTGRVFKTMSGEFSIFTTNVELLTKSLRPLPEKFAGLTNVETCYRQRYIDLMVNENTRNRFRLRSSIVSSIRAFLDGNRYLEVDTNILQSIPSGATARKFETHMNSLDQDLSLRVAPELALKRLVVGGFDRVYEIGKNFRNEGLSTRHNPEFTMLEFYEAYSNYELLMDRIESLFTFIIEDNELDTFVQYGDMRIDFSNFQRMTMIESINQYVPESVGLDLLDYDTVKNLAESLSININENWSAGHIINEIFEEKVESNLIQPTFITEYPVEISPLARLSDDNPLITDRFELFVAGRELGNGFSELNDSEDQERRFKGQVEEAAQGNDEAMPFDEDYIVALEYGLPPTAGAGIGIDRLVMLFTDSHSIKDVMFYPHLKNL